MDRPPARGDRAADPGVQTRAGPRARRRPRDRRPGAGVDFDDEIDLRAEDDALIAAELEAAEAQRAEEDADEDEDEDEDGEKAPAKRRRGRRGGRRSTRRKATTLEATFDHGDEGYGLWLDPAVQDDPIYAEYWAGHRPVEVAIEEDQIVIRRVGDDEADADDANGNGD